GTVQNPVVVESCGWVQNARNVGECVDSPSSIFNSAATKAALKFKYKPKVVDGMPVDTVGVQNKITFNLEE
ncbi:MAG: energy transducer TonB, partial [Pseudomonadales bacterium]